MRERGGEGGEREGGGGGGQEQLVLTVYSSYDRYKQVV